MKHHRHRQGGALVATLATLAFSAALVAALADLVRTEIRLTSERRRTSRLLHALDACLADVVADLPAGWDFGAAFAGADHAPGTADDGVLPAPAGCTARAQPAPGAAAPARAIVRIEARMGAARRSLEGVVRRAATAGIGALVWLSEPPPAGPIAGIASFDGADPATPLPSLAAPADADTLDAWVEGAGRDISPATAAPVSASPPPLAELGGRVLAAPHAGPEALVSGGTPVTSLIYALGDLGVDGARRGAGLLYVDGVLEVRGSLEFEGVLVATRGLRIAPGGSLALDGSVWLGVGVPALSIDGTLAVRGAPGAVARADALLPLPRRAALASTRDVG